MIISIIEHDKIAFEKLIDIAFIYADTAYVVVREDIKKDESINTFINEMKNHLVKEVKQNSWPGTEIFTSDKATVYYYKLDDDLKEKIKLKSSSFFDWTQPYLPEDLGFLKDGREWLVNTAHEEELIILEDQETIIMEIEKIKENANFKYRKYDM